ncbi:MAG TPA: hypothetical protein VE056_02220 [Pyrinomonadaceae bacterium]|nr:hypothetical protein [Pyrinomonadaceae bacterium]
MSETTDTTQANPQLSSGEHTAALEKYWKPSYETLYKVAFQEAISSALADKWLRIDTVVNIVVSITATGSAIAGWALWTQPGWRIGWVLSAGFVSVLSIIHNGIQVPTRLKDQIDYRRQLSKLRVDLETFRQKLELGRGTIDMFDEWYIELRNRYAELVNRAPSDIANTHKLRVKIQKEVNGLLEEEIRD